jgi:hypothetical protein
VACSWPAGLLPYRVACGPAVGFVIAFSFFRCFFNFSRLFLVPLIISVAI